MSNGTSSLRELLPHWLAMFLLMLIILQFVEMIVGSIEFWPSLGLVFAVALVYPSLAKALGIEPDAWKNSRRV